MFTKRVQLHMPYVYEGCKVNVVVQELHLDALLEGLFDPGWGGHPQDVPTGERDQYLKLLQFQVHPSSRCQSVLYHVYIRQWLSC